MAYKSKGTSITFRIEDDVAQAVQESADLEDLTLADFVRKIFRYGFHRYSLSEHGLFPLLQEQREEMLRRREDGNGDGDGKHNRRKTDKKK